MGGDGQWEALTPVYKVKASWELGDVVSPCADVGNSPTVPRDVGELVALAPKIMVLLTFFFFWSVLFFPLFSPVMMESHELYH